MSDSSDRLIEKENSDGRERLKRRNVFIWSWPGVWEKTEMKDLVVGQEFCLEEPDGKRVRDDQGRFIFKVTDMPERLSNGVWSVEGIPVR